MSLYLLRKKKRIDCISSTHSNPTNIETYTNAYREREREEKGRTPEKKREKKSKSGKTHHKPYHCTILPAKSIQWNYVHVKCLFLFRCVSHSLPRTIYLCRSFFRRFTWLHIRFYFLFIFFSTYVLCYSLFLLFCSFFTFWSSILWLAYWLVQFECDAIFTYIYVCVLAFIQKYSMDFRLLLKKKKFNNKQIYCNQRIGISFYLVLLFALNFNVFRSQHNCSQCYKTKNFFLFFLSSYNWLCNYLVSDYLL